MQWLYFITGVRLRFYQMKPTLFEKITQMKETIWKRMEFLSKSISDYIESENYEDAMKCKIKYDTFKLIYEDLTRALNAA